MENYIPTLNYKHGDRCVPIPYSERELQSVVAKPFVKVSDKQSDLEGVCFDKTGRTMYFVNCPENHVCSLNMETKQIKVLCEVNKYAPGTWIASVKVHKDGRLFVPYFTLDHKDGGIFFINPDRSGFTQVEAAKGLVADDISFDSKGGMYITDMSGLPTELTGTVAYIPADGNKCHTVIRNLAAPNGIALSSDEKVLWVTDTLTGNIIRNELTENGEILPFCQTVVYCVKGHCGPDSIELDEDGNVYNAIYPQGRVIVYNQNGYPIGQILMPGRDEGQLLSTTHATLRPNTREVYICTNGTTGTWILRAGGFAKADANAFFMK